MALIKEWNLFYELPLHRNSSRQQGKRQVRTTLQLIGLADQSTLPQKGENAMNTLKVPLFLFALMCIVGVAQAAVNDVYIINPTSPPDPVFDPEKGWAWPDPWELVPAPTNDEPLVRTLGASGSLWLGLGNAQIPNWTKIVTLEFWGVVVPVDFKTGYEDGTTKTWTMELVDSTTAWRKWEGTIKPQPGWEWVELHNNLNDPQEIRITRFDSICVPEPATLIIVAIGGSMVGMLRRRKVA
ncbi:MAG: PEP-CTERM sorting domain-containing protein [Planctomycetes bacterium]|nr:PEP-CTERM sorting domain-containing protein [Planctomycetota bacterium]